jgi:hypothetical protein
MLPNEFNFIVKNDNFENEKDLIPLLFGNEYYTILYKDADIFDILVSLNIFNSKSQARKNWNRADKMIPDGYSELLKIGKKNLSIFIFNPIRTK